MGRGSEQPLLEIVGLTKKFAGLVALSNVDLKVFKGEILGLIGPNGSGKTTLFNVISGSLHPNGGGITFNGHDIAGLPAHKVCKLGVARTFQIPQPFPDMSVIENIRVAHLFGRSKNAQSNLGDPEKVCKLVGLDSKSDVLARSLTVSDKKRLEVGRALATSPTLLLFDEFASGLTAQESKWATGFVNTLRDSYGLTIVWIEHVMRVIMSAVDRVVVLDHGVKIAEGTPQEIVKSEQVLSVYLGRGKG
jgi:branched-chain amino acid transport system ATP-binding protein